MMKKRAIGDNPRGEFWVKDESRFGFQMLEKMGWTKGKGLGRDESGISEPIKVRFKADAKGVGYVEKNDQWMDNQEEFSQLLSRLNSSDNLNENKTNSEKSTNVASTSKYSRNRMRYSKVIKGKDAVQYSEKDMTAIIGKRKHEQVIKEDDQNKTENMFTVSKCNLNDYLMKKMAEKTSKLKNKNLNETPEEMSKSNVNESDFDNGSDQKKRSKRKKFKS